MTLGEFIANYREEHGKMSVRSFASLVDMSPQQIINIEKGIGNDGKPMTSTMKTYKKIAKAVGMDERDFMNMLNDNVLVNPLDNKITATESDGNNKDIVFDKKKEIANSLFSTLSPEDQDFAIDFLKKLSHHQ